MLSRAIFTLRVKQARVLRSDVSISEATPALRRGHVRINYASVPDDRGPIGNLFSFLRARVERITFSTLNYRSNTRL